MPRISLALLLVLTACQPAQPNAPSAKNAQTVQPFGLERAAIESGVIADVSKTSPVGLFQRRHEAGIDALCVMPGKRGELRFGLEAVFGNEPACRGDGTMKRAGDKLILSFTGPGRCIIVAQYDGDQVSLPGVVDMACGSLCDGRGTLEGVSFPRIASDAAAALKARDRNGAALCAAG